MDIPFQVPPGQCAYWQPRADPGMSVCQLIDVCPPPYPGQVNEAEEERLRGEREHQRVTRLCQQAEARVQALQKTLRRAIGKSRPYFELKAQFSQILEVAKLEGWAGRGSAGVLLWSVLGTDAGKTLPDQPVL